MSVAIETSSTSSHPTNAPSPTFEASIGRFHRARWWGVLGGVILAIADTLMAAALGFSFEINGRDATLLTVAYFSSSFAILGYLLGYVVEGRRRERHSARVIQAQMQTLNQARARLVQSEKLAALGQLAAMIAHEVRNPLAVIRSVAQGLAERLPAEDEEVRRASSFVTAEVDRLNNVITALLTFARPPQLQPRPVAAAALVDRALLLARDELGAKAVQVRRHESPNLPLVQVDADLISQVLLGLVVNAIEAVPAGGIVTIDVRARDEAIEIGVDDSGPGIAPALREKIFEPFFTTRARGTGLGLAIARQIVQVHGGRIDVGDGAGGGASFTVTLPCRAPTVMAA